MKNYALFYAAIGSVVSYSCFAQSDAKPVSDMKSQNDLAVVSYHVEERINMNFGGSVRTYNVSSLDLITPKDLGKDNVRVVTPIYANAKPKAEAEAVLVPEAQTPKELTSPAKVTASPTSTAIVSKTEKKKDHVMIDVVGTYERIMDKGYKSVAMITKVADKHFFSGDLVLAAKWYAELFNTATDLQAVYYYRYAVALKAVNQLDKANEMMKIFETKSL